MTEAKQESYEWLKQQVTDGRKSAEGHFETLLVSLNAGGLTLTVGFVKDLVPLGAAIWLPLLPITWLLFVSSLILNLKSHRATVKAADLFLAQASADNPYPREFEKQNERIQKYNAICANLFISAVLTFLFYVAINFIAMSNKSEIQTKPGPPPSEIRGITFPKPPPPPPATNT